MKSLEEKRDKLALDWLTRGNVPLRLDLAFEAGWDACAKEYENEIARCKEIAERDGKDYSELKHQLEVAKKALQEISKIKFSGEL